MVSIERELYLYRVALVRVSVHLILAFVVLLIYMALTVAGEGRISAYIVGASTAAMVFMLSMVSSFQSVISKMESVGVTRMVTWKFNQLVKPHVKHALIDEDFRKYVWWRSTDARNKFIARMIAEFSIYAVAIVYGIYNMIGLIK